MWPETGFDTRLRAPFGAIVSASTMSGKSEYVGKLILERDKVFDKKFDRIIIVYEEWQQLYDRLQQQVPSIEFTKNIGEIFEDDNYFRAGEETLLVLDDVGSVVADSAKASKLFTQKIHHKDLSIFLLINNFFKQGKAMRDIQLNASYIFLLKNVRDKEQIRVLGRQMGLKHLSSAYELVTNEPYQPLLLDLKGDTPDYLRIRSHILPGQQMRVYTNPEETSLPKHAGQR
jgi:hypothetical protein